MKLSKDEMNALIAGITMNMLLPVFFVVNSYIGPSKSENNHLKNNDSDPFKIENNTIDLNYNPVNTFFYNQREYKPGYMQIKRTV